LDVLVVSETEKDQEYMHQALLEGRKYKSSTPPNPWVGCLIVKQGQIIGRGAHKGPGNPHAEIEALRQVSDSQGATLYSTLEPCCHYGRTPPCSKAIIEAGISRVVIGIEDPDPLVAGKGIKQLREAGIEVCIGILEDSIFADFYSYCFHRKFKRPLIIVKSASSLDGKIAAHDNSSKWISNDRCRHYVQYLRSCSQAILVGRKTVEIDKPRLNVRDFEVKKQPLRIVIDPKGRIEGISVQEGEVLIAVGEDASQAKISAWRDSGIEVVILPKKNNGDLCLESLSSHLYEKGIFQLIVEGGSGTYGSFVQQNLIDFWVAFIAPKLIGNKGNSLVSLPNTTIEEAIDYRLVDIKRVEQNICALLQPHNAKQITDNTSIIPSIFSYDF
jgi:diaminohydroxyphosphoribosylaminopyrimidine deaminase / 5-amino-6-(5-phosphoribosylamino)uracil reductase